MSDAQLRAPLRTLVDERPTYGYRRITALMNRERHKTGLPRLNHKLSTRGLSGLTGQLQLPKVECLLCSAVDVLLQERTLPRRVTPPGSGHSLTCLALPGPGPPGEARPGYRTRSAVAADLVRSTLRLMSNGCRYSRRGDNRAHSATVRTMHRPTMPMVADTSTPEESISGPRRLALNRHGPAHFFISPLMKARKSALTRSGSMIAIP